MSNGKQKKRRPGRPKVITPEVEVKLLRLISEGYTKTRACKKLGIGTTTVDEKDEGDRQFAASLARAREGRLGAQRLCERRDPRDV